MWHPTGFSLLGKWWSLKCTILYFFPPSHLLSLTLSIDLCFNTPFFPPPPPPPPPSPPLLPFQPRSLSLTKNFFFTSSFSSFISLFSLIPLLYIFCLFADSIQLKVPCDSCLPSRQLPVKSSDGKVFVGGECFQTSDGSVTVSLVTSSGQIFRYSINNDNALYP